METLRSAPIDVGVSRRSLTDALECGDSSHVAVGPSTVLVAVLDGLGHGADAAAATRAAIEVLAEHPNEPLPTQIWRSHQAAAGTRGLVMGLARIDWNERTLTWAGVGNVQGMLVRHGAAVGSRVALLTGTGVVGYKLPPVLAPTLAFGPGDLLVMWTDGLDGSLADSAVAPLPAQELTERWMERFATGRDDALVLAARFDGDRR